MYICTIEYYSTIKSEWNTDISYTMDEPWRHDAESKKPTTEDYTYYMIIVI